LTGAEFQRWDLATLQAIIIRAYRAGRVSLREAAKMAGVCPREMMDILVRNGVKFGDIKISVSQELKKVEAALKLSD